MNSHVLIFVGGWVSTCFVALYKSYISVVVFQMKHHELSRVCTMGERLTAANHYATDVFKSHNKELRGNWENLSQMANDRATLLSLSVSFHDRQQKVYL